MVMTWQSTNRDERKMKNEKTLGRNPIVMPSRARQLSASQERLLGSNLEGSKALSHVPRLVSCRLIQHQRFSIAAPKVKAGCLYSFA